MLLLLLVLVLLFLLLSMLLLLLVLVLLLSMLLLRLRLPFGLSLLRRFALSFALLMLRIGGSGDSEKQAQNGCAGNSNYFHGCYLIPARHVRLLYCKLVDVTLTESPIASQVTLRLCCWPTGLCLKRPAKCCQSLSRWLNLSVRSIVSCARVLLRDIAKPHPFPMWIREME